MHFYLKKLLTFSVLSFFIAGCTPLFDYKSAQYSHDQQRERLQFENAHASLSKMKNIDIALHLRKEDLSYLANKSFEGFSNNFAKLHSGEFSDVSFGKLEFLLSRQQAFSQLEFSFVVDALQRKVFGHIKGKHLFNAGRDEFMIGTNFDEIVIEKIEKDESLTQNSAESHLISSSVKSFMKALNTEMLNSPLSIPVDMNILKDIHGKDLFHSSDYKLHSARPITMLTKMKMYMPYIYDGGVLFLGASEVKKEEGDAVTSLDAADLWIELSNRIELALKKNMGVSLDALEDQSSCYVSKEYLSKQMNLSLKSIDLRIIKKSLLNQDDNNNLFFKEVTLMDKNRFPSCEKAKRNCSALLQVCQRECERNYGLHKCEDCSILNPFERVRCVNRQEACKRKEELLLYECQRNENRCQIKNNQVRSECEMKNRQLMLQCRERKEGLAFDDNGIMLAKVKLKFDIVNAYAVQRIRSIVFDRTLDTLEVLKDIHVSMDSRVKSDVSNTQNSDINCSLQIQEPLFTHSFMDQVGESRKLSLCTESLHNGHLLIKAKDSVHTMQMHLSDSPYDTLVSQDTFSLECTYQNIPMLPIAGDELLKKEEVTSALGVFAGEIELRFETEELFFLISPIRLNRGTVLYPRMDEKALRFIKRTGF